MILIGEEIKDAGRVLPKSIMTSVGLNAFLGLVMVLTLCFTMGEDDSILETRTGYPFIQLYYNATQSYVGTNIMVLIVTIIIIASGIPLVTTGSRQLWSFARDGGVPFSTWVARVRSMLSCVKIHYPLNCMYVSGHTSLEHSY